ncbi:serine/threonine-protein kinase [Gordonia iterans]
MDFTEIAGYTVIRQLGAGGMGQVFLVQHPRLPRHDALKLLDAGVSRNGDFKARFQREADLLAQLSHPNVITLYDRGEFNGRLWITMEYVDGTDASELLDSRGPLPLDLALALVSGAGAALDYAWRKQRITHRDVKPANILVAFDDGEIEAVKLADFGIAKAAGESTSLTSTGFTVGTMNYISPEAIEGDQVDNRADVYSLGCTAYHLLTGRPPFAATTMTALMAAHLNRPVPAITSNAPDLPVALNDVFETALAKSPGDRFGSCGQFVEALSAAAVDNSPEPAYANTIAASTVPRQRTAASNTDSAPPEKLGSTTPRPRSSWVTSILGVAAVMLALAVAVAAGRLVAQKQEPGDPKAADATASTTTITRSTVTISSTRPTQTPTTPIATVTPPLQTTPPAPVEGQPCNPSTDTRSPDGRLSCSGLDGVWRDMSYQSNPPVQWNAPCNEPGSRARVQNTDAVVTCKPASSGGYAWQL